MPNTELERTDPFEINPPEPTSPDTNLTVAAPPADEEITIGTGGLPVSNKDIRHLCRHIFADGRRCGSPALKTQNFCYYHYAHRSHSVHGYGHWRSKYRDGDHFPSEERLELFDGLDNPTSIQLAITKVAGRIAAGTLNPRQGRSLLYALQLASQNVRHLKTTENSTVAPEIVEDFTWGHLSQLEPGRSIPETLESRLTARRRRKRRAKRLADPNSKPFTGYYPDYKIPETYENAIRMNEGLSKDDPLFPRNHNPRLD